MIKSVGPENAMRKGILSRALLSWDRYSRTRFGRFNVKIDWFASESFLREVR